MSDDTIPLVKSRKSRSSRSASHFSYSDPFNEGASKKKITWWQAAAFIAVVIGLIFLAILTISNSEADKEIRKVFGIDAY